jgi:hypothetical protein
MRTQTSPSCRIGSGFHLHLGDILGGTSFEALAEQDRPARPRPVADRPCDGCGNHGPTVDLWAEHPETGEQLWLCLGCGD